MSERTSISQDLEHLFKKTADANKLFLKESAKFVKRLSSSNISGEQLFSNQKELFKDAVSLFVKLNIQHASNLIDLGTAITKRFNQGGEIIKEESDTGESQPAFILNVSGAAGASAFAQFLLDSDKKEPVLCNLKQTEYILQTDQSVKATFETIFQPQAFPVQLGAPQKIDISIHLPTDATPGVYLSNIQAEGFEHIYFSLFLTVTSPNDIVK